MINQPAWGASAVTCFLWLRRLRDETEWTGNSRSKVQANVVNKLKKETEAETGSTSPGWWSPSFCASDSWVKYRSASAVGCVVGDEDGGQPLHITGLRSADSRVSSCVMMTKCNGPLRVTDCWCNVPTLIMEGQTRFGLCSSLVQRQRSNRDRFFDIHFVIAGDFWGDPEEQWEKFRTFWNRTSRSLEMINSSVGWMMIRVSYANSMTSQHTSRITWTAKGLTPTDTSDENIKKIDKESSFCLLFCGLRPKETVSGRWWFSRMRPASPSPISNHRLSEGWRGWVSGDVLVSQHLHSHSAPAPSLPFLLSFPSQHHTVPTAFIMNITPNCHDFIYYYSLGFWESNSHIIGAELYQCQWYLFTVAFTLYLTMSPFSHAPWAHFPTHTHMRVHI